MGILTDYMTAVKREDYHYRWGRLSRKELDARLQKLARQYDRKMFRFYREGVNQNGYPQTS